MEPSSNLSQPEQRLISFNQESQAVHFWGMVCLTFWGDNIASLLRKVLEQDCHFTQLRPNKNRYWNYLKQLSNQVWNKRWWYGQSNVRTGQLQTQRTYSMSPFTKNSCSAFCWKETSMAPSAFCDIKEFLLGFCHQNCQWNGFNASLNMSSVREGVSQWCSCWLAHGKQYCHFAKETGAQLSKLSKMSEWVRSFWAKISCGGCKRNDTRYLFRSKQQPQNAKLITATAWFLANRRLVNFM